MYAATLRILGNVEDVEDAFVNAFNNLYKFDARVTFGAWLKRITINVCLKKQRKTKQKWLELKFEIPDEVEEDYTIDIDAVKQAIEKLPSGCKVTFCT